MRKEKKILLRWLFWKQEKKKRKKRRFRFVFVVMAHQYDTSEGRDGKCLRDRFDGDIRG